MALTALLAAAPACDPGAGAVRATLPDAVVADAPWEREFGADERTETLVGRAFRPASGGPSVVTGEATASPDERVLPCAGAKVEVFTARPDGRGPLVPVATGVADAAGRFSLGPVPPRVHGFRAVVEGFHGALIGRGLRMKGALNLDLADENRCGLRFVRKVEGRALSRDGKPAAGARVTAEDLGYFAETTTAADGSFSFEAPEDQVIVTLFDPAWDIARATVPPDMRIAPPEPVELRTTATDPLGGFVVRADDGRPVEGATVVWLEDPSVRTRSGADGRFSLPVPRMGRIAAFGAGLAWKSYELLRAGEFEIRLRPSTGVRGRVVDADGKPVGAARLLGVTTNREGGRERVLGPLTAADGTFDFSWMPATPRGIERESFVVAFHRRFGASAAVTVRKAASEPSGAVELKLWGTRGIECSVRDHTGAALPGARVAAEWEVAGIDANDAAGLAVLGVPTRSEAVVDATGTARIHGAARSRPVAVVVSLWGLDVRRELADGAPDERVEIRMPEGRELAGTVIDSVGAVVTSGGRVSARLLDTTGIALARSAEIAKDGTFRLENLPDGRYALEAEADGFDLKGGGEARPGQTDAVLRVEKSFALSVRITFTGDAAAAPARPVKVSIEDRAAQSLPPKRLDLGAGPDGRVVSLGTCHPGEWLVRAEADEWRGRAEISHPEGGGEVTAELVLERTLRLDALLRDADGTPLSGVPIVLVPVASGTAGEATAPITAWTADGGLIDVTGLRPGTWELRVTPVNRVPLVERVQFPTAGKLEFRLPSHGDLDVLVRTADGQPADGAIVSLSDADGGLVYAWGPDRSQLASRFRTGTDGVARIRGVPVRRVRCEVAVGAHRLPAKEIPIEAGKTATLSILE